LRFRRPRIELAEGPSLANQLANIFRELRRVTVRAIYGNHGVSLSVSPALWNRQIAVKLACPIYSQAYDLLAGIDRFSEQQI
jgi:hypothetical protein